MSDAISNPLGRSSRAVPPEVHAAPLPMAARKRPGPLVCAKCGKVIPAGEGHMRAPDLKDLSRQLLRRPRFPYMLPAPTMTAAVASLAAVMDADLDTLVLLGVMALAVAGCVLAWCLIGPRK